MKLHRLKKIISIGVMATVCLSASSLEGLLASIKATGMAATGVAYPQDAEAGAFNPAGITDVGSRFDLNTTWENIQRKSIVTDNLSPLGANGRFNATARRRHFYTGGGGFNKMLTPNLAVGWVVYNRNASKTTYKDAFPLLGTSPLGLEYIHQTISPSIAYKYGCHNFGISVNYNLQRLKVDGIERFDTALTSSRPGYVTNRHYNYSQGVGFTIGWRGQLLPWLSVGATYQPKTHMTRFKKYKGFLAQHGKLDIPQKIGFGIAIHVLPNSTFTFDLEHIQWSKTRSLNNKLAEDLIVDKLGTKNGSGFGFRNQTFYRFGIDYEVNCALTVRAGYRHGRVVYPSSQTAVNLLICDSTTDFFTVGATYKLNCRSEASFFFAHGFRNKVSGNNAIPASLGGGNVALKTHSNILGVGIGTYY